MNNAQESIHIQVYIIDDDETGRMVGEALMSAARRKVKVYVLVDGYTSSRISNSFIRELRESGIQFRFFEPLFHTTRFYFGRRLHHKVFVTDGKFALVSGVNISNNYNDLPGKRAWLDFAAYVEGDAARELCVLCWKTWYNYPLRMNITPCEKELNLPAPHGHNKCYVALRRNDWVRRKNQISSSYSRMLIHAKKEVVILSSYFLPGRFMRRQLAKAAARGITIKVITAGISDIPVIKHAERYLYDWMIRKGIQLFEYQPAILHGKLAVCDNQKVIIGSYNINNLSAYASVELNLEIINEAIAVKAGAELDEIISKDCRLINKDKQEKKTNWLIKLKRWVLFGTVQRLLYLSTFYYRHTVKKNASINHQIMDSQAAVEQIQATANNQI